MRVLFLDHEEYQDFEDEPGNTDFVEANYNQVRTAFVAALAGRTRCDDHFRRMVIDFPS